MAIPKPAASRRTQILAAALMWSGVGIGLLSAGLHWCLQTDWPHAAVLIGVGAMGGWAKGRWILSRTVQRTLRRIETRGDGKCLGGFQSPMSWLFVLMMMSLGYALRHGHLSREWLGGIYVVVGTALLIASRGYWRQYRATQPRAKHQVPVQ